MRAVNFAQAATGHRDGEAAEIFALLLTQVFLVFLPVIFLLGSVPINPSFTESISTASDKTTRSTYCCLLSVTFPGFCSTFDKLNISPCPQVPPTAAGGGLRLDNGHYLGQSDAWALDT